MEDITLAQFHRKWQGKDQDQDPNQDLRYHYELDSQGGNKAPNDEDLDFLKALEGQSFGSYGSAPNPIFPNFVCDLWIDKYPDHGLQLVQKSEFQKSWIKQSRRAQFVRGAEILTDQVARSIREELDWLQKEHNVSRARFACNVVGRGEKTLATLLNYPVPWSELSPKGTLVWIRMVAWLEKDKEGRMEVLQRRSPPDHITAEKAGFLNEFLINNPMPSEEKILGICIDLEISTQQFLDYQH